MFVRVLEEIWENGNDQLQLLLVSPYQCLRAKGLHQAAQITLVDSGLLTDRRLTSRTIHQLNRVGLDFALSDDLQKRCPQSLVALRQRWFSDYAEKVAHLAQ